MSYSAVGCIATLILSLFFVPLAGAQQVVQPQRIGVLGLGPAQIPVWKAFLQGLQDVGYVTGQNLKIEERYATEDAERFPALAAELVQLPVAVIFARGPAALQAATQATETIPIVAIDLESDPVQQGYAVSVARPGGNVTGAFLDMPDLTKKWLGLLKESIPQLACVTVLWDPTTGPVQPEAARAAARQLALELKTLVVRKAHEFGTEVAAAARTCPDAMLVLGSPLMSRNSRWLADLAATSRMPALSPFRTFAEAGGLMAYGPSLPEMNRRCGVQVGKILQGAKPGELAIERPMRFEFVLNLKTAEAFGLTIPPMLLLQADEVIH